MDRGPRPPVIAVTMGDPRGIGAEVIVKALGQSDLSRLAGWRVYGEYRLLESAAERAGLDLAWWVTPVDRLGEMRPVPGQVQVVDLGDSRHGAGPRAAGRASLDFLGAAIEACRASRGSVEFADGLVTGPICKSAWRAAGLKRFSGHTELLAERTRSKQFAMMFVAPQLRVVLATTHIALMDLRNVLTIGRVFEPVALAHETLERDFGIEQPRIAVCGVNPHAGEGGMFGDEETRLIEPAIRQAVELGMNVSGPWPADTVFNAAVGGKFDCVVAMYHDQGTIPVKLLARDEAVNFTIGLPIVRTSPDHGTAFDIAGKNKANPGSMIAAMRLAAQIAQQRMKSLERSTGDSSGDCELNPERGRASAAGSANVDDPIGAPRFS